VSCVRATVGSITSEVVIVRVYHRQTKNDATSDVDQKRLPIIKKTLDHGLF
jgi:hypothetical protein